MEAALPSGCTDRASPGASVARSSRSSRAEASVAPGAGEVMSFRWVAARKGPYYLTVRGPLMDLAKNQLIGECAEERVAHIQLNYGLLLPKETST